ncbi:MAG TPA: hypothetical protein VIM73_02540 [Polyangiaceae bacterium]
MSSAVRREANWFKESGNEARNEPQSGVVLAGANAWTLSGARTLLHNVLYGGDPFANSESPERMRRAHRIFAIAFSAVLMLLVVEGIVWLLT